MSRLLQDDQLQVNNQAQQLRYMESKVQTASPEQLLILLCDGAIRYCRAGIENIARKKYDQAHKNLMRVQDIIAEWTITLNKDAAIAMPLLRLYEYFIHRLIEANTHKEIQPAQEVLGHLIELKETWVQAALSLKQADKSETVQNNAMAAPRQEPAARTALTSRAEPTPSAESAERTVHAPKIESVSGLGPVPTHKPEPATPARPTTATIAHLGTTPSPVAASNPATAAGPMPSAHPGTASNPEPAPAHGVSAGSPAKPTYTAAAARPGLASSAAAYRAASAYAALKPVAARADNSKLGVQRG